MKKKVLLVIFATIFIVCKSKIYGISSAFKFVIDTVGIPQYNVKGQEINEDIYKTYNVFCYGTPQETKTNNQRWTSTKYGKWTKGGGVYKGKGTRGEYYVLGKNYNGEEVHNYYFPLDVVPTTSPDKWTFYNMPGALNSWKDKHNYKYEEQLEFMKNTKLLFNDLSSKSNAMNPNLIKTYNITPKKIGLDKAKLDTSATWKTNGVIYTRRLIKGKIWTAIFLTPPMAANAELMTNLDVSDTYTLSSNEEEVLIPIDFVGNVVNATGYASNKHVKEINISLYINGDKVDNASGSKTMNVGNKYTFKVTREKFSPNKTHSVKVKVNGYLHTEFAVDGLLQASTEKEITIKVEPKKSIPIIKSDSIQVIAKDAEKWVVRPLAQTLSTISTKSAGFTEAGKRVAVKLDLTVDKTTIVDKKIYIDGNLVKEVMCDEINKTNQDKQKEIFVIKIPENTKATLYGWASLRERSQNYFNIDESKLLDRIRPPHELRIMFKYKLKQYDYTILLDTMDTYMENVNTIVKGNILNRDEIKRSKEIQKWVLE